MTPVMGSPFIVTGCFRSGTSSVANSLSNLGVDFGDTADFFEANAFNRDGYWEHKRITRLNRRFLLSLNVAEYDMDNLPPDWRQHPKAEGFVNEFVALLQGSFGGKKRWGWKDPETSLLLPFTKDVLARLGVRPHYVICARNPLAVAKSQLARVGADIDYTLGAWLRRTVQVLFETRGELRSVIDFSSFIEEPRRILSNIVGAHPDWRPSLNEWNAATDALRSDLVHQREDISSLEDRPAILRKVYELCLDCCANAAQFQEGNFDSRINEIHSEWTGWMAMLRRVDPPTSVVRSFLTDRYDTPLSETAWAPNRKWQTLRIPIKSDGGGTLSLSFYGLPASIWIRRAIWQPQGTPAKISAGMNGTLSQGDDTQRLWLQFGLDQLRVEIPKSPGPVELELNLMLEMNNMNTNLIFRAMSEELVDSRVQRDADSTRGLN